MSQALKMVKFWETLEAVGAERQKKIPKIRSLEMTRRLIRQKMIQSD